MSNPLTNAYELLLDLGWSHEAEELLRYFAKALAEAEAERDRAVELLRDLTDVLDEKVWTAFAIAGLVEEWAPKARAFLAEQEQPCQRCGGEGRVVKPDAPGIRTRWYEDCPDCKLKEAMREDSTETPTP